MFLFPFIGFGHDECLTNIGYVMLQAPRNVNLSNSEQRCLFSVRGKWELLDLYI